MDSDAYSILICDDHALVRSGLRRVLSSERDFRVVGEAASAEELLVLLREQHPNVVLLDVTMPGQSGIDALPEVLALSPESKVLMLSMQEDPAYVRKALSAGATGSLLKDAADSELVSAVREVAKGRRYVHSVLGAKLASAPAVAPARILEDPLSEREHEVLRLLALGHTNQEIAKLLVISVRTAESHRAKIVQKLGLKSRAEIVRFAITSGDMDIAHSSPAA
jgi:two-component system, NarL family, response regulator NreC